MNVCKYCKFWEVCHGADGREAATGFCRHPDGNNELTHYLSSCTFFRSVKWRGCLVAFPKGAAIVLFYLLDLLVYFIFGKTLYKRTQGKDKTND